MIVIIRKGSNGTLDGDRPILKHMAQVGGQQRGALEVVGDQLGQIIRLDILLVADQFRNSFELSGGLARDGFRRPAFAENYGLQRSG